MLRTALRLSAARGSGSSGQYTLDTEAVAEVGTADHHTLNQRAVAVVDAAITTHSQDPSLRSVHPEELVPVRCTGLYSQSPNCGQCRPWVPRLLTD